MNNTVVKVVVDIAFDIWIEVIDKTDHDQLDTKHHENQIAY